MEDLFLPEFSFDQFDFDFDLDVSVYEEDLLSDVPKIQSTQNPSTNSHATRVYNDQSCFDILCERPVKKKMKIDSWNSSSSSSSITKPSLVSSSSSQLISFDCSNVSPRTTRNGFDIEGYGGSPSFGQGTIREAACAPRVRSPVLAKEHVLAERKRREKLSERFIALSALLPGLKKSDKATILGKAIAHIKELQERVRELEEEKDSSRETESMILVNKSKIFVEEDEDTTHSSSLFNVRLPEIEARVSREDVLIRIHCEKSKGCMLTILNEIENLHLSVMNSIALPFGDSTLHITVLAKKEDEFFMTVKDLVKNLRLAIL